MCSIDSFFFMFLTYFENQYSNADSIVTLTRTPTRSNTGTVRNNVENEKYQDVKSFTKDIDQISINCMLYNGKTSYYGKYGKKFGEKCKHVFKQLEDAETSRHEIEHQKALSEFHKNTKMPPVRTVSYLHIHTN